MDEIGMKYDEVLMKVLNDVSEMTPGSEEWCNAMDAAAKLYKLRIEESQHAMDAEDENEVKQKEFELKLKQFESEKETRSKENAAKEQELREQKRERMWKYGFAAGSLMLNLAFIAAGTMRGYEFEKNGYVTSNTAKKFIDFWKPNKTK